MQTLIFNLILINTLSGEFNIIQLLNEVAKVECPRNRCGSGRRGVIG